MALSQKEIDGIDQKTKNIVFGFIRQFEKNYELIHNIPDLVIFTCLAFYRMAEFFSKCGDSVTISGLNKDILTNTQDGNSWGNTSYGNIWHNSMDKIIIKWTLFMKKFNYGTTKRNDESGGLGHNILFGIVTQDCHENEDFSELIGHQNYMYSNDGGKWEHGSYKASMMHQLAIYEGDTVIITLDLIQRQITYRISEDADKDVLVHEDIIQNDDTKYKLAVSLFMNGNCVILKDYQCISP